MTNAITLPASFPPPQGARKDKSRPTEVYFLVLPDAHLLDFAGPAQAIHECNEQHGRHCNLHFVSPTPKIQSWEGLGLTALASLPSQVPAGSMVFVCGSKLSDAFFDSATTRAAIGWLRALDVRHSAVIGVCTGAFVLGRAGLLDGRRCTTHHRHLDNLAAAFPDAQVLPERIFVEDAGVFTSAGVTSGIDLTLHLLGRLVGERQALDTARDLVVHRRRLGDDPQISEYLRSRNHISPLVHDAQDYISSHARRPISVENIAERFNVSPRHLQRLFKAHAGVTVKECLTRARLDHAQTLLRDTRDSVERVAEKSGFPSTPAFRDAWVKKFGKPPSQLRKVSRDAPGLDSLPGTAEPAEPAPPRRKTDFR